MWFVYCLVSYEWLTIFNWITTLVQLVMMMIIICSSSQIGAAGPVDPNISHSVYEGISSPGPRCGFIAYNYDSRSQYIGIKLIFYILGYQ